MIGINVGKQELSEAKLKTEAKIRVENKNFKYFDAKLLFAPLASLCSAIFSDK